ncbi:MAG: endonuclease/exonuclease/phosphatase family protein [Alphaproteobacteria bacterium]|nr:endonuclease/exonuclease/phosphatase family protein [Alphaproteobacteria bacterium]MBU1513066.1 endonuclease/exonuclease/phosphatase family protein [Alphaproteobacteria bacterium]MBU2095174.1 endonuclease/exonuclease/phosphatase family protein [Alphaproteobacteria bacterium]MBU2152085.1 endonuclease/exonuclease/phosphatase family protein [Alphaproteobacteria bacterium]MBU2306425.1 endonuclease/exonuclease/phosphatase family protein [Alphaproteobacteria bacterium]
MPRIVTYNVHRCVGNDRRLDVARVAAVLAALKPDIVALQELDVGRRRTDRTDQAHEIARRLEMSHHFHAALEVEEERYGDAILTRYPERLVKVGALPGYDRIRALEPRGALWIEVEIDGRPVQIINTHLGLVPREQQLQAAHLAGPAWLEHARCQGPAILLGDFNATASSLVYRTLTQRLLPARQLAKRKQPTSTFPSQLPVLRIDHLFVSRGIEVHDVSAPFDPLTRVASDHLPLVMDFDLT